MPTTWRPLCEAALREQDPAKIPEACEAARCAISDRLVETAKEGRTAETGELEQALRRVTLHQYGLDWAIYPPSKPSPGVN